MQFRVIIGGVDYSDYIADGKIKNLEIKMHMNAGNDASVTLVTRGQADTFPIVTGDTAEIFLDSVLVFAGTVGEFVPRIIKSSVVVKKEYTIPLNDHNYITTRRLYTNAFEQEYSGNIVKDIVDSVLGQDGIFYRSDTIDSGRIITDTAFDTVRVCDVLDQLASANGYYWYIDVDKSIWFKASDLTNNAPFAISDSASSTDGSNLKVNTLKIKTPRSQYRNRIYVRGYGITNEQTDLFTYDGSNTNFLLGFEVFDVKSVTRNGVPQSFEVDNEFAVSEFMWKFGETQIRANKNLTLNQGDIITIVYVGRYPITVSAENIDEISARAAIENNSGVYESIEENKEILGFNRLMDYVNSKLEIVSKIPYDISYQTHIYGILPGMVQTIVSTSNAYNLNVEAIITDVTITLNTYGTPVIDVKASAGTTLERWYDWFKSFKLALDSTLLSSGLVTILYNEQDTLLITDNVYVEETDDSARWDVGNWDQENWN